MKIAGTSLKPFEVWRPDVSLSDARDFGTALAVTLLRAGSGGLVTATGARPSGQLVLYERETCPFSRLVREALNHLDLDALIKPCPEGETVHRIELRALSGQEQVPFLVDHAAGELLGESQKIIHHLFERYGDGRIPLQLRWQKGAELSSKLASYVRKAQGAPTEHVEPIRRPTQPLELWGYEASPYTRIVRERLGVLGLSHISHNLARRSPRRAAFAALYGREQFPRLFDPNTGVALFESADIARYLNERYLRTLVLVPDVRSHALTH